MENGEIFRKDFMKIKEGLFNIVFPPRCPVCDEVIHVGKDTCEDCRKKRPAKNVASHWKTRGGNTAQTA